MKRNLVVLILLAAVLVFVLSACGGTGTTAAQQDSSGAPSPIVLNGASASYSGKGVAINGNVITITAEGEYHMTGKLDDGQVIIDTGAEAGKVILYLENVDISCTTAPAIYVLQAKSLHLVCGDGTSNRLVSGTETSPVTDGSANGGVIYAEDDVDIEGFGSLEILGYINNGITCKDDVEINSGSVSITAMNNGIKGSESVSLHGGTLNITAGNDGIKATSAAKEGKGFVLVDGCDVSVVCPGDGISAETELTISAGSVTVVSDGDPMEGSCKALKGKTGVVISGGTLNLTSRDHAIHSAAGITVSGGSITATAVEGKAIAAHDDILLSGGEFNLTAFGDGIETSGNISVSGGSFFITCGEDGLHSGEKSDGVNPASGVAEISGGTLLIDAGDDPVDAKAQFIVTGGSLLGSGTAKQPKGFSDASTQAFVAQMFKGSVGEELSVSGFDFALTTTRSFNVVLFTDPALVSGNAYTFTCGGNTADFTA